MTKNYRNLTESIKGRINPENFAFKRTFSDELRTISYSEVLTYIRLAMKGVEPEYTEKSKDAGERVKEHLSKKLKDVVYKYQGSVMTNTHIRGYSDIDLLTICDKFYWYDSATIRQILETPEQKSKYWQTSIEKMQKEINYFSPYQGNAFQELKQLRLDIEEVFGGIYSTCDTTKPKSVKIKNLSLNREVDVVVASWYDDVTSVINDRGDYRGIQVYNKETDSKESADYPFLSINRINERSSLTNGRLKKMIRFLKNSKANSNLDIKLSSFDINAICYDIEISKYSALSFYELIPVLHSQLREICINKVKADNIVSVDGKEYIFRYNSQKLESLKLLLGEVEGIFIDLKNTIGV